MRKYQSVPQDAIGRLVNEKSMFHNIYKLLLVFKFSSATPYSPGSQGGYIPRLSVSPSQSS